MMEVTTVSVFVLFYCFFSEGLKCSVNNDKLIDNINSLHFTHCESDSTLSKGCGNLSPTVVNNSTGLISVDIPINPFGLVDRTPMEHSVTLFHCKNRTSASDICDCDRRGKHQHYTFSSASIKCKNDTNNTKNTTLMFHNVWTDEYQLLIKHGKYNLTYLPFNVSTNFQKPPKITASNTYFSLFRDARANKELQANFGTNVKFGPPLHQLELSIYDYSDVHCGDTDPVAKVYINTTSVTEFSKDLRDNASCVRCENDNVCCVAASQLEIRCLFRNLSSSKNYTGIVRFKNDLRCLYDAYGENTSGLCCVRDNDKTSIEPTSQPPPSDPPTSVSLDSAILIAVGLVILVAVLTALLRRSCYRRHQFPTHRHSSSIPVLRRASDLKPTVMLLYAREPEVFMNAMVSLRRVLSEYCKVIDVFDQDGESEEMMVLHPARWLSQRLSDKSVRVVLVVTACTTELLNAPYHEPHPLDPVFAMSYNSLHNQHFKNARVCVVRLSEELQPPTLLHAYSFCLPKQLQRLVETLLDRPNLPVPQDECLNKAIDAYNQFTTDTFQYKQLFIEGVKGD